ncbi:hypothetical protein J6P92_02785 [bacterium]|nr:hypothetical protein [bacterium]
MKTDNIRNYNRQNYYFTGSVKSLPLYKNYALEYAKGIKLDSPDWAKLKMFINTIRAVKNDGTNYELIIDTVAKGSGKNWLVRYGDYIRTTDSFETKYFNPEIYDENIGKSAFYKIVQFGKEYFGLRELTKPLTEFSPADQFLRNVNLYSSKARQTKNRDASQNLTEKASKELQRGEEAISGIRLNILNNL